MSRTKDQVFLIFVFLMFVMLAVHYYKNQLDALINKITRYFDRRLIDNNYYCLILKSESSHPNLSAL